MSVLHFFEILLQTDSVLFLDEVPASFRQVSLGFFFSFFFIAMSAMRLSSRVPPCILHKRPEGWHLPITSVTSRHDILRTLLLYLPNAIVIPLVLLLLMWWLIQCKASFLIFHLLNRKVSPKHTLMLESDYTTFLSLMMITRSDEAIIHSVNSCHVLIRRLATLRVWPSQSSFTSQCNVYKEGQQNAIHGYWRNVKNMSWARNYPKFWHARFVRVLWCVPDTLSLFFDHVTQEGRLLFLKFLIGPSAVKMPSTAKQCKNLAEFVSNSNNMCTKTNLNHGYTQQ